MIQTTFSWRDMIPTEIALKKTLTPQKEITVYPSLKKAASGFDEGSWKLFRELNLLNVDEETCL